MSRVALAALLLAAVPCFAQDRSTKDVAGLLRGIAETKNHEVHVRELRRLEAMAKADSSLAVPAEPVLELLRDRDEGCRAAALAVLVATHARRPGGLGKLSTDAAAAIVPLAASQRRIARQQARAYLETLTGEKKTLLQWAAWREKHGGPVLLEEVVALVSSGSVNGVRVPDVAATVAALEARADVAGVPFRAVGDAAPPPADDRTEPAWELAPKVPFEEWTRRAEALLARHDESVACDPDLARARAEKMVAAERALRHDSSPHAEALRNELRRRRASLEHHASLHALVNGLVVTAVVVDPLHGGKAIIVMPDEEGDERRGRIYSEGDALLDRDNRRIPGIVITRIHEGGIQLSLDGENADKDLKSAN